MKIPKLSHGSFFPSLLAPRRRIDQALHAVIMQAYVEGVSTRSVDDLVQALGIDSGISKSEVSRICAKLDIEVDAFRNRSLAHVEFPYVYLDATYVKARDTDLHQVVSRAVVIATGITAGGGREILGLAVGDSEAETFWTEFLRSLRRRGLAGVKLVISDAHEGLKAASRKTLQGAAWQRCRVHFARNLLALVPKGHQDVVAAALRTVFVHPNRTEIAAAWDRTADMFARQFLTPRQATASSQSPEATRNHPTDSQHVTGRNRVRRARVNDLNGKTSHRSATPRPIEQRNGATKFAGCRVPLVSHFREQSSASRCTGSSSVADIAPAGIEASESFGHTQARCRGNCHRLARRRWGLLGHAQRHEIGDVSDSTHHRVTSHGRVDRRHSGHRSTNNCSTADCFTDHRGTDHCPGSDDFSNCTHSDHACLSDDHHVAPECEHSSCDVPCGHCCLGDDGAVRGPGKRGRPWPPRVHSNPCGLDAHQE